MLESYISVTIPEKIDVKLQGTKFDDMLIQMVFNPITFAQRTNTEF